MTEIRLIWMVMGPIQRHLETYGCQADPEWSKVLSMLLEMLAKKGPTTCRSCGRVQPTPDDIQYGYCRTCHAMLWQGERY